MFCKFCSKEISNKGGLKKHENGCVNNPNKIIYKSNFHVLTKEQIFENTKKGREKKLENLKLRPFELWGRTLKEELILNEQSGKCSCCKITKFWNGKPLIFELDHIDGDNKNNKRKNLRLICPNCHSQTKTWRGRNINSGITKVSDEILISNYNKTKNIRQALILSGLAAKGGNYNRIKKLLKV